MMHAPVTLARRIARKGLGLMAKVSLTLLAFWLVAQSVEGEDVMRMLHTQERSSLGTVAVLVIVQILLGALRWHFILGKLAEAGVTALRLLDTIRFYYISVFFNFCLPGTVGGDVVRVWLLKRLSMPLTLVINSVILDRVTALLGLLVLVLASLPVLAHLAGFEPLPVFLMLSVGALAGLFALANLQRMPFLGRLGRVGSWLTHLAVSVRQVLLHPSLAAMTLGLAVFSHMVFCLAALVLAESLGMQVTFAQVLALVPPVVLASTLPISIGGWGVREMGMVATFGLIGIPAPAALTLSLQLGLISVLVSLPGGLLWLAYRRRGEAVER